MAANSGAAGEAAVAAELLRRGYVIVDRNWRTPHCEIDIIARKQNVVYIVEVKFRRNSKAGSGFDYITSDKIRRLERAAERWCLATDYTGPMAILGAETGPDGTDIRPIGGW